MTRSGRMIIAAYAGTGKSEFCKRYPSEAIDMICMPYKYINLFTKEVSEGEDIKANMDLILRPNWENDYYEEIKRLNSKYPERLIIVPTIKSIMRRLKEDEIPYTVVYPTRDCKEEYRERYINRGNNQSFLDVFIEGWDVMLDGLDCLGGTVIEIGEGQYLSDVIQPKSKPN